MRLHNFIVERDLFDDDCRRFYAVNPDIEEGVYGGESDNRLDEQGNKLVGSRPPKIEVESINHGKVWRNAVRDENSRQNLVRPEINSYGCKNRAFDN